jgi:Fe-S-cluster containining protein
MIVIFIYLSCMFYYTRVNLCITYRIEPTIFDTFEITVNTYVNARAEANVFNFAFVGCFHTGNAGDESRTGITWQRSLIFDVEALYFAQ